MDLITAHLAHLRAAGKSHRTIDGAAELLNRLDRELPWGLDQALKTEIIDWLGHRPWAPSTKAVYRAHIVRFLRWAVANRYLDLGYNPAEIPRPRVPKHVPNPATDDQLAAALRLLYDPWRLAVILAAYAGLRACEIAGLRREDVTVRSLRVLGKGQKVGEVPTHPIVWTEVKDRPAGFLVTRADGNPASARYVFNMGWHRLHRAGLDCSMHRFRAWYATSLLRANVNLRVVQECMRHVSVATTEPYTLVTNEERESAVSLLPTL